MANRPSPPWTLSCPWCAHRLIVYARGMRGGDMGSGYEAACRMRDHVEHEHGRAWADFLAASAGAAHG